MTSQQKPDLEFYRILDFGNKTAIYATTDRKEILLQMDMISKQVLVEMDAFGIYSNPYRLDHYPAVPYKA